MFISESESFPTDGAPPPSFSKNQSISSSSSPNSCETDRILQVVNKTLIIVVDPTSSSRIRSCTSEGFPQPGLDQWIRRQTFRRKRRQTTKTSFHSKVNNEGHAEKIMTCSISEAIYFAKAQQEVTEQAFIYIFPGLYQETLALTELSHIRMNISPIRMNPVQELQDVIIVSDGAAVVSITNHSQVNLERIHIQASEDGDGIYIENSQCVIDRCDIRFTSETRQGKCINVRKGSSTIIKRSWIGDTSGGGIACYGDGTYAHIQRNMIRNISGTGIDICLHAEATITRNHICYCSPYAIDIKEHGSAEIRFNRIYSNAHQYSFSEESLSSSSKSSLSFSSTELNSLQNIKTTRTTMNSSVKCIDQAPTENEPADDELKWNATLSTFLGVHGGVRVSKEWLCKLEGNMSSSRSPSTFLSCMEVMFNDCLIT